MSCVRIVTMTRSARNSTLSTTRNSCPVMWHFLIFCNFGFRCEVDEKWILLGYNAPSSGEFLSTFRVKRHSHLQWWGIQEYSWPLKMGQIVCLETSVRNCHYSLCDSPEYSSLQLNTFLLQCRGHGTVELYLYPPSGPHLACNGNTFLYFFGTTQCGHNICIVLTVDCSITLYAKNVIGKI